MFAIVLALLTGVPCLPQSPPAGAGAPVVLDRVIAVVNGDVLLESDVREEMRFAVLQPYSVPPGSNTAQRAAGRLISRSLILQQMKERASQPPGDEAIDRRIADTRKMLPACMAYKCLTEEGWTKFLRDNDLARDDVRARVREQLEILKFIEVRFQAGILVSQAEIEDFYQKTLVPQFEKNKQPPPPIASVSARVEEILLQQKVNGLLREWLQSLREQGGVQILDAAYAPSMTAESEAGGDE